MNVRIVYDDDTLLTLYASVSTVSIIHYRLCNQFVIECVSICNRAIYSFHISHSNVFVHIMDKRTPSRPLGEVKLRRPGPVVRWVTTREAPVLKANFFLLFI